MILPEILYRARRRGARVAELQVSPRPRWAGRAKGGQLSVAIVTLVELARVALLARWDEARRDVRQRSLGPTPDPLG